MKALLGVICVLVPPLLQAEIVSYSFSGTLYSYGSTPGWPQSLSGSFTYDTSATGDIVAPWGYYYHAGSLDATFSDGSRLQFSNADIDVHTAPATYDTLGLFTPSAAPPTVEDPLATAGIPNTSIYFDFPAGAFASLELAPLPLPPVDHIVGGPPDDEVFWIMTGSASDTWLLAVQAVPEPSALTLLA